MSNDWQSRLNQAGLKNIERFSWDESDRKAANVYKAFLNGKSR